MPLNPQPSTLNQAHLLSLFDRVTNAPDAIPRLRQFILDLAVRGKLVEQDPKDEPASELLQRIRAERRRLAAEGELKPPPEPSATEPPPNFRIPPGWAITHLGALAHKITDGTHKTPTYVPAGIPFISVKDFSGGTLDFSSTRFISPEEHETLYKRCDPRRGDMLIGRIGTLGKPVLVETDNPFSLFVSVGMIRFSHAFTVPSFLRLLLDSPFIAAEFARIKVGGGTHTNKLNLGDLHTVAVPLPPLAEQHRIVAKVDELMSLCDRLEAAQAERETRRTRLVASTHASLSDSALRTPHSAFFISALPRLTTRPSDIQHLRQTILNLAVRGKLVPQDPSDEPIAARLECADQTRRQTAAKDRRADPRPQSMLATEHEWQVPQSWAWRALADLVLFIDYRGQTPTKVAEGITLITAKNVKKGYISTAPEEFITESNYHAWMTRGLPQLGDVLFTTEAPIGNAAVVQLSERFALAQRVICFHPYGATTPDFLVLQILSRPFQSILDKTATGLTAKGIKAAKLKRLPIAIPPLAEQYRIVAKVDELMALCDRLEAQLTTTQTQSRRLLESTLHQALTKP